MAAVVWFIASVLFVDLIGYWLHRWAHRPGSPMYRAHMTHHVINYPPKHFFSSTYRTSGSDSLALWLAPFGALYAAGILLSGLPATPILLGGASVALLSSIFHDMAHIADSPVWKVGLTRRMAFWHRVHHRKMGRNFGILSDLWDRLFRTHWTVREE